MCFQLYLVLGYRFGEDDKQIHLPTNNGIKVQGGVRNDNMGSSQVPWHSNGI